ncbi:patatin-like phospholipase family protein [uncultured Draconibacterium sp.]|uniref:patatin-like phospholipase family protein n=1 Tax=uncultured Draconibacterium sp. TaxID=1573823 RepID=UPI0032169A97
MDFRSVYFSLLLLVVFTINGFAQVQDNKEGNKRPKVGLVMSGGGAKGFAYIGLLKVLEEVDMPIDYIGGSSMGAITAALYSVGYSAETISQIIREQDWDSFISDVQERKYVSFEEKLFSDKFVFTLPLQGNGVSLSKSLNTSFNIDLMLNNLFAPVAQISDFSQLPVPFLCVGTDLLTGEAIVLKKGNLARAVRASMAIPGYFSPTKYDGRYLIDGGVVNNYPAEYVKEMGADIIIGLDVQSGLKSSIDEIESITTVLDQVISFYRVEANKRGMKMTDHYVKIDMPYGMLDFNQYDSIMAIGERVARENYADLKALADSLNELDTERPKRIHTPLQDSIDINQIVWADEQIKNYDKYQGFLTEMRNNRTALSDLEQKMLLLNGSRVFNELRYELEPAENDKVDVKIETGNINKGSLSAGIHYDNYSKGSVLINLALRNIKEGRAKLFTDMVLGENPRLKSMFIINNGFKPGFGMETDLYLMSFSQYDHGKKVNKWDFDNLSVSAFIPMTIKNNYLIKFGFKYENFRFKQDVVIDPELDAYNKFADYGNLFFSFHHDSRNRTTFSSKGRLLELQFKHVFPFSDQWSDILSNGSILSFRYNSNIRLAEKWIYKPEIFAGYTFTDKITPFAESQVTGPRIPAVQHLFAFGGLNPRNYVDSHISFTGLRYLESLGIYAGKISTNFEYNFYPKLYVTFMTDVGMMENELGNLDNIELLLGYGTKFSYNSFIGPVELVFASSNIDRNLNLFFNVGFWF